MRKAVLAVQVSPSTRMGDEAPSQSGVHPAAPPADQPQSQQIPPEPTSGPNAAPQAEDLPNEQQMQVNTSV